MTATRPLRLEESGGRWSVLELPADRRAAVVQAAVGVVAAAPAGDGRARSLERLTAGGEDAVVLALAVLREALGGRPAV